jgi:murein tripeptide amidase MpaA
MTVNSVVSAQMSTVESTYQSNTVTTQSHSTYNKAEAVEVDRHPVIPTTLACDPQYQAQFELELQARDHMIANLKEQVTLFTLNNDFEDKRLRFIVLVFHSHSTKS